MDVEKLDADKQTDALVAEMVMGWRSEIVAGDTVIWHSPRVNGVMAHGGIDFIPPYSTDIAAAWSVVEHIKAKGNHERGLIDPCVKVGIGDSYFCEIFDLSAMGYVDTPLFDYVIAEADTAPLAICRAALKSQATLAATGQKEG